MPPEGRSTSYLLGMLEMLLALPLEHQVFSSPNLENSDLHWDTSPLFLPASQAILDCRVCLDQSEHPEPQTGKPRHMTSAVVESHRIVFPMLE